MPKRVERDYFDVAKRACTHEDWEAVVRLAVETAKDPKAHPIGQAKARDFLLKALAVEQAFKIEIEQAPQPVVVMPPEDAAKVSELMAAVFAARAKKLAGP